MYSAATKFVCPSKFLIKNMRIVDSMQANFCVLLAACYGRNRKSRRNESRWLDMVRHCYFRSHVIGELYTVVC